MQSSRWVLAAACVVAILSALASLRPNAAAQSNGIAPFPPQQTPSTTTAPTIHVTSREAVVDVTVTDAKGNPVHGLKQSDFTVKEDGKPQSIRSFEEFSSEPAPEPEKLPPNIYTNRQLPPASSAVNVLWLDFTNSAPGVSLSCCGLVGPKSLARAMGRQRQTKQDAMKYLQNMPSGTRVAVLGSSNKGHLRVLQGVTSDPALLSAAVDTMEFDTDAMAFNGETWCSQQERRNRMTLESLNQIAADLAVIKGRKNLVWFTTGIPTITDPNSRPPCLSDYSAKLKSAYATLAASQVTVFPIWVRGVPADGDPFGENHIAEELSMESVAEDTGGTAYYNNNDLVPFIAKAIASGSDFYTLTYVPPGKEYDGRHHTIHLDVDQPGLHLTYRDEYYAEDPAKMAPTVGLTLTTTPPDAHAGDMKAAMSRGMPTSSDLLFYVAVEPSTTPAKPTDPPVMGTLNPSLNGKPLTRYNFTYSISAGRLAFTNGPNATHNGSVELDLAAYDADAKLVTSLSQTVNMSLNDKTVANKQPLNFSQQIDLPPGQLFLRVGVLDRTSNKVGTLELPLTVAGK
ncbi:MAG: VWA domain-containing protein [Acidobacteriaceae bacterium]